MVEAMSVMIRRSESHTTEGLWHFYIKCCVDGDDGRRGRHVTLNIVDLDRPYKNAANCSLH